MTQEREREFASAGNARERNKSRRKVLEVSGFYCDVYFIITSGTWNLMEDFISKD